MKISPMPSSGLSVGGVEMGSQTAPVPNIRSLRMSTNATPGQVTAPENLSNITNTEEAAEDTAPLSPQFAALAKQRRALQKEKQAFERERALAKSSTQDDMIPRAQLKSDWLRTVLDAGLSWDDLTKAVVDYQSGPNAEFRTMRDEMKSLKDDFNKQLTERDSQAEQQALREIQRDAEKIVISGDDFELVRESRSIPKVMKVIYDTYKKTGRILETRDVLQAFEEELISDALKQANYKKVQQRLAPPPQAPQQRYVRTLTNRDTASPIMDRKQRALAAALGQPIKR